MSFLKSMELPEWTILGSLLALPVVGWWISDQQQAINVARKAATKNLGELEVIGELQSQVELVEQNSRATGGSTDAGTYFQMQLTESAGNGGLKTDDYQLTAPKARNVALGTGRNRQRVTDYDVNIKFQKKDKNTEFTVGREFLFAVLFNCESGARRGSASLPAIWKLQKLSIVNASAEDAFKGKRVPPQPADDSWIVRDLMFSRREPRKN